MKTTNENAKELELARLFEVEELEERMEFGKWSGEASGGYSESQGAHAEGSIKFEF